MEKHLGVVERRRVFVLSPARLDGARGKQLFAPASMFPVAKALHEDGGVSIGDVYRFVSALYFRGKLAYASAFALALDDVLVITPNRGLVPATTVVTLDDLHAFAAIDLAEGPPVFREPFERDVRRVYSALDFEEDVVLLGSIASDKYVATLVDVLGARLLFPSAFVGRGDMSRGGLLLRAVDAREELSYAPVVGAVRKGKRPEKLARR